tara:strand:- start:232 stop:384 length:153 start_codon:yes stop_codon:yes gene_type:complete
MHSSQQKREYLLYIPQGYHKEQQEPLALVIYTAAQATDSEPLADTTVGPS